MTIYFFTKMWYNMAVNKEVVMEYYTIRKKNSDDKTLCRIENGVFSIYTYKNKSTGEWLKNSEYEKIFNDKCKKFLYNKYNIIK